MAADFDPYCRQCGSDDLAYIEQYADSKEYKCRECGSPVMANVEMKSEQLAASPAREAGEPRL
jgi:hypothetical protein